MNLPVVEVSRLRVDYDEVVAVNDISFNLEKGNIYGFVGPNGAGKTSTIKALAGILEPKQGTIKINGYDLEENREKALTCVGYMPDFPPVYDSLKVWEYLDVFAAAYGLKSTNRLGHVDKWLESVGLTVKRNELIKGLSRGMRQRLVLAKTLEFGPDILLLDEPASGLDPIARKQMRDLLKEASVNGATILISSHILAELSEFVDSVIILEKGNLLVSGTLKDIGKQMGGMQKLVMRFANDIRGRDVFEKLAAKEGIPPENIFREKSQYIVRFYESEEKASRFLGSLLSGGVILSECSIKTDNIEDIFLKVGAKEVS